jgi:predicted Rossmann fold flavoprotein
MKNFDVLIIGAGGAGMMAAIEAGKRGRKTALLDHSAKIGAKILISGGGRCNFTNLGAGPGNYVSHNPHFCKSALSRYTPNDFIQLVKGHHIPYHEKKLGQLFCDRSARDIVGMLEEECRKANVEFFLGCECEKVQKSEKFEIHTDLGNFSGGSLVIATGGLSIPKVGATDFGYRIARQFGLKIVEPAPALDGFRLKPADLKRFGGLMGVSVDAIMTAGKMEFRENILFTHAGLSGPAALQASLYWHSGQALRINFVPKVSLEKLSQWFQDYKKKGSKLEIKTLLGEWLPHRLADRFCEWELKPGVTLAQLSGEKIKEFCGKLQSYSLIPQSTVGYAKAEVTRGGIDTDELSSRTMECKKVPGLYFIGEVVDVTGWLGGYNFQWAWSSGWAAGQVV